MPIRLLSLELVRDIVKSYGQITKLNLSTNEISRIESLEHLTCLTKLNLSCNRLGSAAGCLDGLANLTRLRELDISDNNITNLQPLASASGSLEVLNVANNLVAQMEQVSYLASLTALTELVVAGNPVASEEGYRRRILSLLPSLTILDHAPREDHQPADGGDQRAEQTRISADENSWWRTDPRTRPMASMRPLQYSSEAQRAPDLMTPAPSNCMGEGGAPDVQGSSALCGDGGGGGGGGRDAAGAQAFSEGSRGSVTVPGLVSKGPGDVAVGLTARHLGVESEAAQQEDGTRGRSAAAGVVAAAGTADLAAHQGATAQASPCCVVLEPVSARISKEHHGSAESMGGIRRGEATQPTLLKAEVGALPAVEYGAGRGDDDVSMPAVGGSEASLFIGRGATGAVVTLGASPIMADRLSVGAPFGEAAAGLAPVNSGVVEVIGATVSEGLYPSNPPDVALGVSTLAGEADRSQATAGLTKGDSRSLPIVDGTTGGGNDEAVGQESWTASPDLQAGKRWRGVLEGDRSANVRSVPFGAAGDVDTSRPAVRAPGWKERGDSAWLITREEATAKGDLARSGSGGGGDNSSGGGVVDANRFAGPSRRSYDVQAARFALHDCRPSPSATRSHPGLAGTAHREVGVRSSLPWGWGRAEDFQTTTTQRVPPEITNVGVSASEQVLPTAGTGRGEAGGYGGGSSGGGGGIGVGGKLMIVDRGEWEALRRENDSLRQQFALAEKRCDALGKMQRLADNALSEEDSSLFSASWSPAAAVPVPTRPQKMNASSAPGESSADPPPLTDEREPRSLDEGGGDAKNARGQAVSKLLACWRGEVLKLLLQRGVVVEAAAAETRKAAKEVTEANETRLKAETEAKSLAQRALAAEADAELLGIKLAHAFEELRDEMTGCLVRAEVELAGDGTLTGVGSGCVTKRRSAESSSRGYVTVLRDLRVWVQGFVGRASEGIFEREALLARGVAKLEAFSQRLGQAAGRLHMLETLLQHKEVQLRNSRAALAADRRVWLLERRDREAAALSKHSQAAPQRRPHLESSPLHAGSEPNTDKSKRTNGSAEGGRTARVGESIPPLLEGLRPECEAVMRALFCRVDRLGTGAVRARRLLNVLRSDCGVAELMEAAVGARRWAAALNSMETALCPAGGAVDSGGGGDGDLTGVDETSVERDVTWGEFLLFFLPSAGRADDAYNAGLVFQGGGSGGGDVYIDSSNPMPLQSATSSAAKPTAYTGSSRGATTSGGRRSAAFGGVTEDSAAMLRMVVPPHWTPGGGPRMESAGSGSMPVVEGGGGGGGGGESERGLAALSVGQLRREVLRLARERGFLLALVREEGRLGRTRADAVHDQYRHELRELHAKTRELEFKLEEALRGADEERERGNSVEAEASELREKMKQAEQSWQRRLDAAGKDKTSALADLSREASKAADSARERMSRLEAEHALALRENGKASVRQRALERELARVKNSMETEARLEKEGLEERLHAGELKLTVARRERNALLAALREIQRRERIDPDTLSPLTPPEVEALRGGHGGGGRNEASSGGYNDRSSSAVVTSVEGRLAVVASPGGRESDRDGVVKVVETSVVNRLPLDERAEENDMSGPRSSGRGLAADSKGVEGRGDSRAASLSARLEMLTLQTRQLLADDGTSCSSDEDSDSE